MAGRHRAANPRARKSRRPTPGDIPTPHPRGTERSRRSWPLPVGLGLAAAALLGGTVSITEGLAGSDTDPANAALAMSAPTTSSTTSTTTTSSRSTDKPTPSSTTAKPTPEPTPKPSTTTPTTTRKPSPPPPPPTPEPEPCSTELEGTQPHVAQVGNHVLTKFDVDSVGGVASRSGASDHPSGLALDFMTTGATGDRIAEYILANQSEFGVTYVIWEQRYNDGSGWSYMEDRGSDTANHYDHVHVSFEDYADVDVTC